MPPAVCTRWNSASMGLEAMLKMRDVFRHIRETFVPNPKDETMTKLLERIPRDSEFDTLALILPVLVTIRNESETLSADKRPTSMDVLPSLYKIHKSIDNVSLNLIYF